MSQLRGSRQQQILDWLRESGSLTIDELVERLGVSAMTVHRDLDQLAREGVVEKVHGGVRLTKPRAPTDDACHLCNTSLPERTAFIIHTQGGGQQQACCPHCGFQLLDQLGGVSSVLVRDFLYERVINAAEATYLIESDVSLCCVPSVLSFASRSDAERFQRGFGGQIADFSGARHLLQHH